MLVAASVLIANRPAERHLFGERCPFSMEWATIRWLRRRHHDWAIDFVVLGFQDDLCTDVAVPWSRSSSAFMSCPTRSVPICSDAVANLRRMSGVITSTRSLAYEPVTDVDAAASPHLGHGTDGMRQGFVPTTIAEIDRHDDASVLQQLQCRPAHLGIDFGDAGAGKDSSVPLHSLHIRARRVVTTEIGGTAWKDCPNNETAILYWPLPSRIRHRIRAVSKTCYFGLMSPAHHWAQAPSPPLTRFPSSSFAVMMVCLLPDACRSPSPDTVQCSSEMVGGASTPVAALTTAGCAASRRGCGNSPRRRRRPLQLVTAAPARLALGRAARPM